MFFKVDGHQTTNIEEAHSFEGFGDAVQFCKDHKLRGTELVFRTGRPEDDLRVRIDGEHGAGQIVKWWLERPIKS
jgi:hypothetical protein